MTMTEAGERVHNFSPGPAAMPYEVLRQVQEDLLCLPGAGASILEISHRSAAFSAILEEAEERLRGLLRIPSRYSVLFLQGGARLQFSMVAMNLLLGPGRPGAYVVSGSWGGKALDEARREGETAVVWSGADDGFRGLPADGEVDVPENASYVHMTSNETIQGVQFQDDPSFGPAPLVCDSSSDFLSRPVDVSSYGLIYACAQKNAGAAGLTIVIVRDDLLERSPSSLASMLDYRRQAEAGSRLNTPPCFGIYVFLLILRWLEDKGGLARLDERNTRKARMLYEVLDGTDFYRGHAEPACRSKMNVTFQFADDTLEAAFLDAATRRGLCSLKGHRSVGGIRASIYNAMSLEGVEALCHFMQEFEKGHAPR